jgi:hypothetical protein
LLESACDFASTFWLAELGPDATFPALIVTGAFAFTGVCFVADFDSEACSVSDFCAFSCAPPAPPQPAAQRPESPTVCVCDDDWFVGAELLELACDFAAAFWLAELGPDETPPALIATGAFAFTGVCSTADFAAEACSVSDFCAFSCAPPAPPHPPEQLAEPPTVWLCVEPWFVGAELLESACEAASAFWFAELGPDVTPSALIVTGAFAFTAVC